MKTNEQTPELWVQLANAAIIGTDDEPHAVSALMHAAAAILQRRFGNEEAARLMVEVIVEASSEVVGGSGIIATKH